MTIRRRGHFIEAGLAIALLFAGGSLFWAGKRAIECECSGGNFWEVAGAFGEGGLEGIVYTYGAIETTLGVLLLGDTVTGGKATGSGKQTSSSKGFDEAMGYDNSADIAGSGLDGTIESA